MVQVLSRREARQYRSTWDGEGDNSSGDIHSRVLPAVSRALLVVILQEANQLVLVAEVRTKVATHLARKNARGIGMCDVVSRYVSRYVRYRDTTYVMRCCIEIRQVSRYRDTSRTHDTSGCTMNPRHIGIHVSRHTYGKTRIGIHVSRHTYASTQTQTPDAQMGIRAYPRRALEDTRAHRRAWGTCR